MAPKDEVMKKQVGGNHYKKHSIQPWDIIDEFDLNFYLGNALKYLLRDKKNKKEDLQKAVHYLEKEIADYEARETTSEVSEKTVEPFEEDGVRLVIGRATLGEDTCVSPSSEELRRSFNCDSEGGVGGYKYPSSLTPTDSSYDCKLPSSEEPAEEEVGPDCIGRKSQVDWGIPEAIADLERLKKRFEGLGYNLFFRYSDTRGIR